ncbi:MAG: hypothetical protein IJL74_01125 [Bacilli bacterium]|nr:hypothetical protein [Bacilli bacterium]
MKGFLKKEIQEKTTMGRIVIESLLYAVFITALGVYTVTIFTRPEMISFAKIVKEEPITSFLVLLPAVIVLVECITIGLAMFKLPNPDNKSKKKEKKSKK